MAYFVDQYGRTVYQPDPPMDRLQQLQAQRQIQQQPTASSGINWVSGEAGAKSWIVTAGNTVLLMDSENPIFYLKSADGSGMPLPLRVFEYKEVTPTAQNMPQSAPQAQQTAPEDLDSKYVTREEYKALQSQYAEIMDKLNSFHAPVDNGGTVKGATQANAGRRSKGGNDNE